MKKVSAEELAVLVFKCANKKLAINKKICMYMYRFSSLSVVVIFPKETNLEIWL
jgi:hypothetical protein